MTKVCVIGLDGVPLNLIQPWLDEGYLPHLAKLIQNGSLANLNSTIPHTSAPAWTSFMTGKGPGKTGIYDFLYRQPGSYTFPPNNSRMRDGEAIWQILSKLGKRVAVMNIPLTYPVDEVNGTMISGWMTPYQAKDFAYPAHTMKEMETAVGPYTIYPLATYSEKKAQAYFDACRTLADQRTAAALHLLQKEEWDFFMTVFFDTDRIMHQLWHLVDPTHRWREHNSELDLSGPVRDYFSHLDQCIGRLLAALDEETTVIVMSDHGMGAARDMVVLNTWLLDEGWIKLKRNPLALTKQAMFRAGFTIRNIHQLADRLGLAKHAEYKVMYSADRILKKIFLSFTDVDWSQSKAYSFGRSVGPIYLNVKGREPQGIVEPGAEYHQLRQQLADLAMTMRHPKTGQPLVREVLFQEDIYEGPYAKDAPDMILQPYNEADKFYGLSDFGANQIVLPMYRYSGMHRQHGIVILNGTPIQAGATLNDAQIVDVVPTILHLLGVPIPDDMDGRPLIEAFTPQMQTRPIQWQPINNDVATAPRGNGYNEQEAAEVEDRLRQLGYLG